MVKKFWKRCWKRFLSLVLAVTVAVTSIPVTEVQVANALPDASLASYDYSHMESIIQDGKEIAYRNNFSGLQKSADQVMPMSFGEMVYLQFALPYNTYYQMKVLDEGGAELGYMYAEFYTEHKEGSVEERVRIQRKIYGSYQTGIKEFRL